MRSTKGKTKSASDYPEFVVTRESFQRYFDKPLPTSTFHDLVSKGKITPMKGMRGFYLLNDSLRRLGLREVRELPQPQHGPSLEEIVRLGFFLIHPNLFPAPSWLLTTDAITPKDADHARLIAITHQDEVNDLAEPELKLAYFQDADSNKEEGGISNSWITFAAAQSSEVRMMPPCYETLY